MLIKSYSLDIKDFKDKVLIVSIGAPDRPATEDDINSMHEALERIRLECFCISERFKINYLYLNQIPEQRSPSLYLEGLDNLNYKEINFINLGSKYNPACESDLVAATEKLSSIKPYDIFVVGHDAIKWYLLDVKYFDNFKRYIKSKEDLYYIESMLDSQFINYIGGS